MTNRSTSDQEEGDTVYCRVCGGEATIQGNDTTRQLTPTGRKGTAADLEPVVDRVFVNKMIQEYRPLVDTLL